MGSAHHTIWGSDEEGLRKYRRVFGVQVALGRRTTLVMGGHFNAIVVRQIARQGVCGMYGLGRMNQVGRYLIVWCKEHGLCYENSVMGHERRVTWFRVRTGSW